jgi:hypothetical protein
MLLKTVGKSPKGAMRDPTERKNLAAVRVSAEL